MSKILKRAVRLSKMHSEWFMMNQDKEPIELIVPKPEDKKEPNKITKE